MPHTLLHGYVLFLSAAGCVLIGATAIAEGFRELHIVVPAGLYFFLTFAGVVGTLRPGLPAYVRQAGVAANVLALAAVIMICVAFFTGQLDLSGATGLLFCASVAASYIAILKSLRAREIFTVPDWVAAVVVIGTAGSMVLWLSPDLVFRTVRGGSGLAGYADELRQLNAQARIAGAVYIATVLMWAAFVPYGFRRAHKTQAPRRVAFTQDAVQYCPSCGHPYRSSDYRADAGVIYCSRCKEEIPRQVPAQ